MGWDVNHRNWDRLELIVTLVEDPDLAEVSGFWHAVTVVVEQYTSLRYLVGAGANFFTNGFHIGEGRIE